MLQFRPYFRHGNPFGDLRSFPAGAAPPVDPHSWSPYSTAGLEPQSVPLIRTPPGDDNGQEEEQENIRAPELVIHPQTQRNGLQGIVRALVVFNLTAGLGMFFLLFLALRQVRFKSVMREKAFMVDESRPGRLTALAIASTTVGVFQTPAMAPSLIASIESLNIHHRSYLYVFSCFSGRKSLDQRTNH
jgi:hypothetical protein